MDKETWKQIPGYEKYEASNLGKIRSFKFKRMIRTVIDKKGYERIIYHGNVFSKNLRVAHLVLLAFVGERPEGKEASHLNGIRTDNRSCNLKWETSKENWRRKICKMKV